MVWSIELKIERIINLVWMLNRINYSIGRNRLHPIITIESENFFFKTKRSSKKMRLNPKKCIFGVRAGKFLGFSLMERGIEANPNKCEAIIQMVWPTTKKKVMKLNTIMTSLNWFILKFMQHALPFYKLLKKETRF